MNCPTCNKKSQKFGKTRDKKQRFRCADCRKTFSDPKPLAGKSTSLDDAVFALKLLLEGMSVRATSRMTGLDKNTILRIMVQAGEQCEQFLFDTVWNVPFKDLQIDEQWSFVGMKDRTAFIKDAGPEVGDAYVFTAIDRDTRFIACFHMGKRDSDNTWRFIEKLYCCVSGRPQITSDGFKPYYQAVPLTWRHDCDFAQLVKKYGNTEVQDQRRYSPANIIGCDKKTVCGKPKASRISTSHIERHNLSNRMHNRRFTRLTNGFSKKWENHQAMFALYTCWYNWCRPHMTLKTTPAVAAGLAKAKWSLEKLLQESARVALAG